RSRPPRRGAVRGAAAGRMWQHAIARSQRRPAGYQGPVREFAAWMVLITVVASWLVTPWRTEAILRLFNAQDEDELMRRFTENWRFMAAIGLVLLLDVAALALALIVLF